jgi:hypothetical protein
VYRVVDRKYILERIDLIQVPDDWFDFGLAGLSSPNKVLSLPSFIHNYSGLIITSLKNLSKSAKRLRNSAASIGPLVSFNSVAQSHVIGLI